MPKGRITRGNTADVAHLQWFTKFNSQKKRGWKEVGGKSVRRIFYFTWKKKLLPKILKLRMQQGIEGSEILLWKKAADGDPKYIDITSNTTEEQTEHVIWLGQGCKCLHFRTQSVIAAPVSAVSKLHVLFAALTSIANSNRTPLNRLSINSVVLRHQ